MARIPAPKTAPLTRPGKKFPPTPASSTKMTGMGRKMKGGSKMSMKAGSKASSFNPGHGNPATNACTNRGRNRL